MKTKTRIFSMALALLLFAALALPGMPAAAADDNTAYISGYPDGTFLPDGAIKRAEAAQLLYQLANTGILQPANPSETTVSFWDVTEESWYYPAVTYLGGAGVLQGYPDGSFRPGKTISRAELTALAVRYSGLVPGGTASFTDVPADHWAAGYIAAAQSAGFAEGYPDGSFHPGASITRAETVAMLNRMTGRNVNDMTFEGMMMPFTDVPAGHWAYWQIMAAAGLGQPRGGQEDDPEEPGSTKVTLTYDENYIYGTTSAVRLKGNRHTVSDAAALGFSRTGYLFNGWNTKADGSGENHQPGETIRLRRDITLYAQWDYNGSTTFTVTYESNRGVGGPRSFGNLNLNDTHTVLAADDLSVGFRREGHTFISWNTKADGSGVSFAPGNAYTVTDDLTLYAQWLWDQSTYAAVTYVPSGGYSQNHTDPGHVPGEDAAVLSLSETGIERRGFNFQGWNTEADGSGNALQPGDRFQLDGDTTLYAQWQYIEYTIFQFIYTSVDSFGRTETSRRDGAIYGTQYNATTFASSGLTVRPGYNCNKWNAAPDGSGREYYPGDNHTFTDDFILYAIWDYDNTTLFTVTYDPNGGDGAVYSAGNTFTPSNSHTVLPADDAALDYSRAGYTFTGWNSSPDGSGIAFSPGTVFATGDSITLYAQWE